MSEYLQPEKDASMLGCDALFFGDSITADSNFEDFFPELRIVNFGVYGDTIDDLLRRAPKVQRKDPAAIFLLVGVNSLACQSVDLCLGEYAELVTVLREACPAAELYIQSVLPVGAELVFDLDCSNDAIRRFNEGLRALAAENGLVYIDLWAIYEKNGALDPALTRDGVHLNYTAYAPWAEAIRPYLFP